MKKWLVPLLIIVPFALWALWSLIPKHDRPDGFAFLEFGRLPVLTSGRIQPIDSLARNSLLQLLEKQTVNTAPWKSGAPRLTATQWALEMMATPDIADTRPVFRIDHPQLKSLLALPADFDREKETDGKNFTWLQVQAKLEELQHEQDRVRTVDASKRNPFDQAVIKLANAVGVYMRLQNTLQPQNARDWGRELKQYLDNLPAGVAAARAQSEGKPFDQALLNSLLANLQRFETMGKMEPAMLIPPLHPDRNESWARTGEVLTEIVRGETPPYSLTAYARIADAYRQNRIADFQQAIADYRTSLRSSYSAELTKCAREQYFNGYSPFLLALSFYAFAGLCVLVFWVEPVKLEPLRRGAFGVVLLAFAVHASGLVFRMWLEGRPPVTNLYSSAIFIGVGACVLGIILELFWRNAIGLMVASVIGFATLIIAHHLSLSGDTMEMMRAVLDSNFWLATHVVVVTLGYSSTFVAGILALLYILMGVLTKALTPEIGKSITKMVYGIVCFATLFSFVGTVLGGIWADQSWGRFWGWDPKENGALIIVLWNALVLHARWGGLVKERGLMVLVIGGNIVTAWSWFGVNMLGIGLHSYGFTSAAFWWLSAFGISQLLLIALGLLPKSLWRSTREPLPA